MNGLKKADVGINRQMLAALAVEDRSGFAAVVEAARPVLEREAEALGETLFLQALVGRTPRFTSPAAVEVRASL